MMSYLERFLLNEARHLDGKYLAGLKQLEATANEAGQPLPSISRRIELIEVLKAREVQGRRNAKIKYNRKNLNDEKL